MSVTIKKKELDTLATALSFARSITSKDCALRIYPNGSLDEILDDARRVIIDLYNRQIDITKKHVELIKSLRNDEKFKQQHREASRRYYQKHKKKTEDKNVKLTKIQNDRNERQRNRP